MNKVYDDVVRSNLLKEDLQMGLHTESDARRETKDRRQTIEIYAIENGKILTD